MQVILLERVAKLGQMGDVVKVKDGYARNFLLPQGKALRASDANIKNFEAQKAQLEARNLETRKEAEALGEKLDGQTYVVIRSASDAGALYGSVTARHRGCRNRSGLHHRPQADHAERADQGSGSARRFRRPAPRGFRDRRRQRGPFGRGSRTSASGKSIQELAAEAEAAAEFEIAELFDEVGAAAADE